MPDVGTGLPGDDRRMNTRPLRNITTRLRRGAVVIGGAAVIGSMLIVSAPAASASPEKDCQKHGGTYSSVKPGDGHVYSSCDINGTTIGWKDGKDPVTSPSPK
jgi:hypothetical protein